MRKFLSQHCTSILVFIHAALMLIAFSGLLALFSIYIYDWYRDSTKLREDIAYKRMQLAIEKIGNITNSINHHNFLTTQEQFIIDVKQLMLNNPDTTKVMRISIDKNNEIINKISIRRDSENSFYYPASILQGIALKENNEINFSSYSTLHDYINDDFTDNWSDSLDAYTKEMFNKFPVLTKGLEDGVSSHIYFTYNEVGYISGNGIILVYKHDSGKIIYSYQFKSNFLLQYIKKLLGDNFLIFFIEEDGRKLYFQKSSILEAIDITHEDFDEGVHEFTYAGSKYSMFYHKSDLGDVVIVAPSAIIYAVDKPIDYSLIGPLLLAMIGSSLLAIFYFGHFRKNVRYHVDTILKNQKKSSKGRGLDYDMSYIRDNFNVLNRYMPNNFRSFKLSSVKDLQVNRQEICIMFIQLEQLETNNPHNLNKIYQNIIPCIFDTGGVVDKLMGNLVLAVWLDKPDHVLVVNACKSALAVVDCFKDSSVKVQIGINIGTCDVGSYGNKMRAEYTISGSSVNLTSRICKIAKEYGTPILLSEYVVDCLDQAHPTRLVDAVIAPKARKGFYLYELLINSDNKMETGTESNYNSDFAHAFKLYQNKRWKEALVVFQKIEKYSQGNSIIKAFIRRIKSVSIPKNWQGYWQL